MTINGDFQVVGSNSVTVEDGLTLDGTATLGDSTGYGYLYFTGTQTLGGSGTVNFATRNPCNALWVPNSGTTLTIGAGITVHGQYGSIGYSSYFGGSTAVSVVNQGTINSDSSGGTITVYTSGAAFQNSGTLNASAGTISIYDPSYGMVNSGTVAAGPTGTLDIDGPYSQSSTGNFDEVLGGSSSALYGQTSISGTASLNGALNISETNGFSPSAGDVFTFLTYTSETGQFANYTGLVLSGSAALEPTYNSTSATLTTVSDTTIAPDLRVTHLSINPASPQSSQSVTVKWDDFNDGNGSTGASWTDQVVVTNTTTGQTVTTAYVSYNAATRGDLARNALAAQSYTVNLPDGPAGVGDLQISVTTDYYETVNEYYPGGGGYTNNTTTITAVSTLAPYPDLQVTNLATSPTSLESGETVTIDWDDANTGNAAVTGSFVDYVTAVNTTTGQTVASNTVPYNEGTSGPIVAGGYTARQCTLTLPDGTPGVGQIEFMVTTNYTGAVFEYNSSGTAQSNNTSSTSGSSTIAPYADLLVSSISFNPASGVVSGDDLAINWTDANDGDAATPAAWLDHVIVADVTTGETLLDQDIAYDPSASGNSPIAPNGTLDRSISLSLPQGAAGVGDIEVTITTDAGDSFFEWNSSGTGQTNNTSTADITSTIASYPDLQVQGLAVSPTTILSGNTVDVTWNDANTGNAAVDSSFVDNLTVVNTTTNATLLDTDITFNPTLPGNSPIVAGGSVAQAYSFALPQGFAGAGDLVITVTTDADNQIFEYNASGTGETNNTSTLMVTSKVPTYTVNSIADSGAGSLRDAIDYIDAHGGGTTIDFDFGTGPQTIDLLSPLPAITVSLTIDGTTEPGYSGTPLIELDGSGAGAGANGLTLAGNGIIVKGLIIGGFGGDGIEVTGNNDLVESSYIGVDSTGNHAMGNGKAGVALIGGATGNTIGGTTAGSGNVISSNAADGLDDIDANSNLIVGNWIGTNATGTAALGNGGDGVFISGSTSVIVGGTAARRRQSHLRQRHERHRNQWLNRHADSGQPDRARPDRNTRPGQPRSGRSDRQRFPIHYHRSAGCRGA